MRPNAYEVLARAVEEGAAFGWRRAFKYTPKPTDEEAIATIASEVMNAICEWFSFDDETPFPHDPAK